MTFSSIGDLSRSLNMRQSNFGVKQAISAASQELTTGLKRDIPKALGGHTARLSYIEHKIGQHAAFKANGLALDEAANGMQLAIDTIQRAAGEAGSQFVSDILGFSPPTLQVVVEQSHEQLKNVLHSLNANIGGRYLFSGENSQSPAVISADDLMTEIRSIVAGAANAGDAIQSVKDWFDAPPGGGGFDDIAYLGGHGGSSRVPVGETTDISLAGTAAHEGFKHVIMGFALGNLISEEMFDASAPDRHEMMQAAGTQLLAGESSLTMLRTQIGQSQSRIESTLSQNASILTTLGLDRLGLIEADREQAATDLLQAQSQMEALYVITGRLSKLSLSNYL